MTNFKRDANKWLGLALVIASAFKTEIQDFLPLFEPQYQAPITSAVGIVIIALSWWKDQGDGETGTSAPEAAKAASPRDSDWGDL